MPVLRVALAQIDLTVGDLAGNLQRILAACADATGQGAQLVALPEMALTGYPPEDLVLRPSFRAASREHLELLAGGLAENGLGELAVVVGYLGDEAGPRNASAFCLGGEVVATYYKHHLPNYGVFDERRYFVPGERLPVVGYRGVDVAMTICEDAWQEGGPFTVAGRAKAGLVLCINGSPYELNKDDTRLELLQRRAAEAGCPVAYVNTVGGQDELVFDGDSFVVDAAGRVVLRAPQFVEGVFCVDLELPDGGVGASGPLAGMDVQRVPTATAAEPAPVPPIQAVLTERIGDEAEVWGALVTGTRDYIIKNSFRTVVLGMSGGIDSAVVAAVAADAIGGANVYGVSMPSGYSSEHSRSDAVDLARRLGAHYQVVPIAPMVDAFVGALGLTGVAEENVQARVRGTTLMSLSNQHGHLVLATGNKSELAVGYSTIYGDAVGGFAPLKDVPKTLVWALARWRNAQAAAGTEPPIPPNSISKPPSAELRPGQLDSDSLPDYALLDPVIAGYVDGDLGVEELIAQGHDPAMVRRVARMVDAAEWKRRQYPPGPKISLKAFGRDRRLPIANRWGRDEVVAGVTQSTP